MVSKTDRLINELEWRRRSHKGHGYSNRQTLKETDRQRNRQQMQWCIAQQQKSPFRTTEKAIAERIKQTSAPVVECIILKEHTVLDASPPTANSDRVRTHCNS